MAPSLDKGIKKIVLNHVFTALVRAVVFGELLGLRRDRSVYIPAARTGLMIAFPALVFEILGDLAAGQGQSQRKPTLNLPTSRFLQSLSYRFDGPRGALSKVADWLEEKILHGKIIAKRETGFPSFKFQSSSADMIFPLHATSSMVTELAPFLIALRSHGLISLLVFEEPEAHLHLSAQRIMAQALARIVNLGVTVIVTSHSDTFVQEINNLIQIHESSDKKRLMEELGYEDADLIAPKNVKGYEFTESGDETEVSELKLIPEGFVVPSLNEAIRSLAEETVSIQEKGIEADD